MVTYTKDNHCARCNGTKNLTKDHIVPVAIFSKMSLGDMFTDPENIQTLCRPCNQLKGSCLDHKNPRTHYMLRKMFNRWTELYGIERKKNVYAFRNLPVRHDTTTYHFGVTNVVEDLKDIYRKQRATWRTR